MSALAHRNTPEEIYEWLRNQSQARSIDAELYVDQARDERGWLHLPVSLDDALSAYQTASTLQELEDSWNDQEPSPDLHLALMPTGRRRPQHQGVWHDVHDALEKQKHAIDLYGLAEDKEAIAAEFWSAREDFEASLKELERVMPRNGHAA